jgi:dimethylamine/trimethylamine dehydrogenase
MANVELYLDSELDVEDIFGLEHQRIALATGATWTKSLYTSLEIPAGELDRPDVYTPDDLAAGVVPEGPVLVYDFDNYYLGGVIAESLAHQGLQVCYATPAGHASAWTIMTNEQPYVHQALDKCGVEVHTQILLSEFDGAQASLNNIFTKKASTVSVRSVVIVGLRLPNDTLYQRLMSRHAEFSAAGIKSVERIGDAMAAGALVHAVYAGHSYARQLDRPEEELYLRDIPIAEYPHGAVF